MDRRIVRGFALDRRRWRSPAAARRARRQGHRKPRRRWSCTTCRSRKTVTDYEDFPGRTDAHLLGGGPRRRLRLSRPGLLPGRHEGQEGRVLFQIDPRPFKADARPGQGGPGAGRGARQAAEQRVSSCPGPLRPGPVDQPRGVRPLRLRPRRGGRGPGHGQGQRRPGGAGPRVHQGHRPDQPAGSAAAWSTRATWSRPTRRR